MTAIPRFYARAGLHVEAYDAFHDLQIPKGSVAGDIRWYIRLARRMGGPVLEGGCGTGRVTWPIARAGVEVVGLDRSRPMLAAAERKRTAMPAAAAARASFLPGDFRTFDLGRRRFPLAIVPFRAFQSLLTVEDQFRALRNFRRHLRPRGLLVLDLFDPRLDFCHPGGKAPPAIFRLPLPGKGTRLEVEIGARTVDPVAQVLTETWTFRERDRRGRLLRREQSVLRMRWTYREEMRHLLARSGFRVVRELSDFRGSPPAYGKEQIWIAARGRGSA